MGAIKRIIAAVLSVIIAFLFCTFSPCAEIEDGRDVSEILRDGFYRFSESIDIGEFEIMPEELTSVLASVLKDDPYLFFVNGSMSYSFIPNGKVLTVKPQYVLSGEDAFMAWSICRAQVRELAKEAQQYSSDTEKALYLHDRICLAYEYDDSLESDTMYSFFESGKGTCQSYAHAYMAVLRECGIESHYVASDSIEHIWNYVKLDGEWYHADLTWDDSAAMVSGVSKRHFLCSDRVAAERGHADWYSSIDAICDSDKFLGADFDKVLNPHRMSGDVDHNGDVSVADLLRVRNYAERGVGKSICLICADADRDGKVGAGDVAVIRKKLLGTD